MIEKSFFEKFEVIADAPDAMAKMRELVLQLAVQGRLVPQDESNEPADLLLNCAAKQAQKLPIATKYQSVVKVAEEHLALCELPLLPSGWVWTCSAVIGDTAPRVDMEDDALVAFAPMNLLPTDYRSTFEPELRPWREIKKGYTHFADGDVGFAKITPCFQNGKGCVFKNLPGGAGSGTTELHILRPFNGVVLPLYALLFYKSPEFVAGGVASFAGTAGQQRVSNDYFRFGPFPLPPLAEQKRIVAKVDELMALCDQLEVQQQEREARKSVLVRASLARFVEAPTPANLSFLFHKSYDIPPAELRKSILTLAVQGKLVPQDPMDGDAREMIDRAMAKRQKTIRTKSLRRKMLDESADLFEHSDLPTSWCVERFANLVDPENTISYGVLVPGNDVPSGIPFVRAQDLCLSNHPARPNKTISPDIEKPHARTRLNGGEILLCVVGSIGKLGVVPDSWAGANIARAVARIKPIPDVLRDYLLLVLQEQSVQNYFTLTTRTLAQPTLNVGMIEQTPIPVPPLAEQRRIVAKVDQLMALVDELERQLDSSRATASKLLDAIVHECKRECGVRALGVGPGRCAGEDSRHSPPACPVEP